MTKVRACLNVYELRPDAACNLQIAKKKKRDPSSCLLLKASGVLPFQLHVSVKCHKLCKITNYRIKKSQTEL